MVRLKSADAPLLSGQFFQIRYVTSLQRLFHRGSVRAASVLLWFVSLTSAVALYRTGAWFQSLPGQIGLGLAFGGALGNLLDILQHKFVIDFLDLGWWPAFNLADVGIISGLVLAFAF
jgi:lipoprotein signal peptidase